MNLIEFGSPEDLREFIDKRKSQPHPVLAPAQQALTYGDTWVHFADLDNAHVIFGRVFTPEEMMVWCLHEDPSSSDKIRTDYLSTALGDVQRFMISLETSDVMPLCFMFDRFLPEGSIEPFEKAHVWPVDRRVFEAVEALDGDYRQLADPALRFLLELAFRQARAYFLPTKYPAPEEQA